MSLEFNSDRLRRFTTDYSDYSDTDYSSLWEDFDEEFSESDEDIENTNDVVLVCIFVTLLSIIFLASITTNVSILLVFARKQTLRTTSNR